MDSSITAPTASVQTPEADEIEAPTQVQQSRPLSFSNGVLKRHLQPLHVHLNVPPVVVITYKECLKNHAASLGGHALDGCGEFMASPTSNLADPTSLRCAACSCHRNFHRREPEEPPPLLFPNATQHLIEYQPHHRHHPPPPQQQRGGYSSPNSSSPPPISSSYFPSAPHMLLALSNGLAAGPPPETNYPSAAANGRKRFRTRFTVDQKDRMLEFADRVGWKMQKRDEELIADFCGKIGVDRSVFKVWMHNKKSILGNNKKSILGKRDVTKMNGSANSNGIRRSISLDNSAGADQYHHEDNKEDSQHQQDVNDHQYHNNGRGSTAQVVATNGSSSSSL